MLIDRIAPFSFDRVSKRNRTTLYGLLMKHEDVQIEDEDLIHGVHPVAARYLVYKLTLRLEEELKGIVIPDRDGILSGAENKTTFDIERTRRVENLDEYFKQLGLITSTKEIAYFISQFKKYNEFDQMLCEDYEVQMLKRALYQRLLERTQKLCKTLEGLFATFVKSNAKNSGCLLQSLSTEISENIKRNASNATNSRIMYVYSDKNAKEELFETLDIDFAENNSELNQSIVDGAYGSMCATEKPSYACNKEFVNKTLEDVLYDCLYENYENRIDASTQISGTLSMSIVDAIRKECEATAKPGDDIGEKLKNALAEYKRKLTSYAAPFLKAKPNLDIRQEDYTGFEKDAYGRNWMRTASGQLLYMESRTSLTFWGINSDVVDENDHLLSEVLGINTLTAKDKKGYSRNELYCYRSIYAILAEDIPKFNELEDGDYYKFYSALVLKMLGREGAEYDTPHIDKTWHRVLPYISTTMRNKATGALYETIWKAIAYNTIVLDKGKYRIRSRMTDSFGKTHSVIEDLYENGRDIASGEIARLIRAVQSSDEFEFIEARELERTFEDDLRLHANKETDFMKNLAITGDLNPVSMMVRYMNSTEGTQEGFADMVGALTTLLDRVVKADTKRKTEEEAKTELLQLQYQIYSKCLRPAGKKKCFEDWVKEFEKNKIVKK